MSELTTTVGIVGLGNIGYSYDSDSPTSFARTHARAATLHPDVRLEWGVDPSGESRAGFENEYGIQTFTQLEQALNSNPVDVVVLAVSIAGRSELWPIVLESKPKMVISEKPLALSFMECAEISNACADAGIGLLVNYPRRYSDVTQRARQLIETGELGRLQVGHVWYGKGVRNNGSHLINQLVYLFGNGWDVDAVSVSRSDYPDGDIDAAFKLSRDGCKVDFLPTNPDLFSLGEIDLVFEGGRLRFVNQAFDLIEQVGLVESSYPGYSELGSERDVFDKAAEEYQLDVITYAIDHLNDATALSRDVKDVLSTASIVDQVIKASLQK
jgi:hypothetical protein